MASQKIVIVGTQFRGAEAMVRMAGLAKGDVITLQREPKNPHDPGAVACYAQGVCIGYLPKSQYTSIRDALDAGFEIHAEIAAEALMQGDAVAPGGLPRLIVKWENDPNPVGPDLLRQEKTDG